MLDYQVSRATAFTERNKPRNLISDQVSALMLRLSFLFPVALLQVALGRTQHDDGPSASP